MTELFLSILIVAFITDGSCTPTRIIHDDNTRDELTPPLLSWDLWDTYSGKFSSHIPDMYMRRPTIGQLKNFGAPVEKFNGAELLRSNDQEKPPSRIWLDCDNLKDMEKQKSLATLGYTLRCRRMARDWWLQEPLYVDEPRWIPLDRNTGNEQNPQVDNGDPFIVARGKRSSDNQKFNSAIKSNRITTMRPLSRRKRELNINNDDDFTNYSVMNSNHKNGYLQPRDKHSDIMDILKEPFFISRGKKNYYDKKSDIQPDVLSFVDTIDLNSSAKSRPIRDRRGDIVEQLLKEQDPFYIARGRRGTHDLIPMFSN